MKYLIMETDKIINYFPLSGNNSALFDIIERLVDKQEVEKVKKWMNSNSNIYIHPKYILQYEV